MVRSIRIGGIDYIVSSIINHSGHSDDGWIANAYLQRWETRGGLGEGVLSESELRDMVLISWCESRNSEKRGNEKQSGTCLVYILRG